MTLDLSRTSQHNARVLTTAQALGGASPAIIVSLGGLVGQQLASNPALATLPVSIFNLGLAIGTLPAAWVMRRHGRRLGYLFGAGLGMIAGLVAAFGIYQQLFVIFCLGTMIAGFYASYVQSYRFAVADGAPEDIKPRLISWVMVGGLFAAVIGPQTVIWTRDIVPWAPFAGSFVAQAILAALAIPVIWRLKSATSTRASASKTSNAANHTGRTLKEIARQPRFILAVTAGVVSYALMSFVMTAAPIAMVGCGHTVGEAALGIQWHVLAMFAPSFFTGRLIQRFGVKTITALGLIILAASGAVALAGLGLEHFWIALVLLGVGWNLGFIGATTMVTTCHRPEEKNRVQAMNDFLVFGSVAISSFASGKLLSVAGWELINWLIFPCVAVVLLMMLWEKRHQAMLTGV
ncbi:MFS transporter [Orrella daihaiensis]|uniref:MFS transporter n=1 Tax=Orrella daihaiensis TaxID=2782176 RepID=A0ABY4AG85_9BURK|nr:MFS transporter [Orrella daihaiensis]UOD49311.1 MFS transporter [Orrella daihaiensis]